MHPEILSIPKVEPEIRTLDRSKPIRLNLGGIGAGEGGLDKTSPKIPGFLIVDLDDHPDTDIRCNVADLSCFEDNSVDEIYASNVLEHFPHIQTLGVLKEWHRVLKPGSTIWISVPDMDANFKIYQKYGLTDWVRNLIWGDQWHVHAFHYVNFTFASLAKAVVDAGFSDIVRVQTFPFGLKDGSQHCCNANGMLMALNVRVKK